MEETLKDQIVYIFVMQNAYDAENAVDLVKTAFQEGDLFMLPKDNEIKNIFESWAKSTGLKEARKIAEDMFDGYNEAIDDVLTLMKRLKTTDKEILMKKIEKLKKD